MHKNNPLRIFFLPLMFLYSIIVSVRNKLFDLNILKSKSFNIPIISVGNITVGGTGKTPHIEYLVSLLKKEFNIATLSRGYKRKTKDFLIANDQSTVADIGDEPKQIKDKFPDITVAVDRKRVNGINTLLSNKENTPDVILLDDAYQHRYVKPGLSILLVDYNRPISKDFLLPYGSLREKAYNKRRANIIIVTKCPQDMTPIERRIIRKDLKLFPYQILYFTSFKYGDLTPVFDKTSPLNKNEISDQSVLLVTGIANPDPLKKYLANICKDLKTMEFADHHAFTENDIQNITQQFKDIKAENKIIITTEKDAIRFKALKEIAELTNLPFYYIPIKVNFLNKKSEEFNDKIIRYVRKNSWDSRLHS